MAWKQIVPPLKEPVNLDEMKEYLRITHAAEDGLIQNLITDIRYMLESYLQHSFITQTLRVEGKFPVRLVHPPLQRILHVEVAGTNIPEEEYALDPITFLVTLKKWRVENTTGAVEYSAGYGENPQDIPPNIRLAIMSLVHRYYDLRSDSHERTPFMITPAIHLLLSSFYQPRL